MQRNGQNPIKANRTFGPTMEKGAEVKISRSATIAGICPKCQTEVPPKPGFRFSALRCPKCGSALKKP